MAAPAATTCVAGLETTLLAVAPPAEATPVPTQVGIAVTCGTALTPTEETRTITAFTTAHLERLQRIADRKGPPVVAGQERGFAAQQVLRELEQSIRLGVLDFCRQATEQGLSQAEAAVWLKLSARTVRHWAQCQRQGVWQVRPRGRPLRAAPPEQLQDVVAMLHRLGPATGLAVLQGALPELARAELQELLRCYRQAWQGQHPRLVHVLHWQEPGRVWAMDYAEAPCLIDGRARWVLAVRDLASGQQLCWWPVPEATAACTLAVLECLFALYGPPLVLKSDNGSPFCAEVTRNYLQEQGVEVLFSPPRTPSYNGSCEAAIGSLKQRTAHEAERQGHGEQWTGDDLEQARQNANATARPRGHRGPTPAEVWQQRRRLGSAERQSFAATVRSLQSQVCQEWGWPPAPELGRRQEATLQREVLRRALVGHGYLLFTRRRIPIPIRRTGAAKIT